MSLWIQICYNLDLRSHVDSPTDRYKRVSDTFGPDCISDTFFKNSIFYFVSLTKWNWELSKCTLLQPLWIGFIRYCLQFNADDDNNLKHLPLHVLSSQIPSCKYGLSWYFCLLSQEFDQNKHLLHFVLFSFHYLLWKQRKWCENMACFVISWSCTYQRKYSMVFGNNCK